MRRALVITAAVGLLPAAAIAQDPGSPPDWVDQAKIVAQMQGISVGEAVRRVRLQEKVAELDRRFSTDPNYGGAWIEQKGQSFRATFGFKGGKGARSIDDPELSEVSDFVPVATSMSMYIDKTALTSLGTTSPPTRIFRAFGLAQRPTILSLRLALKFLHLERRSASF